MEFEIKLLRGLQKISTRDRPDTLSKIEFLLESLNENPDLAEKLISDQIRRRKEITRLSVKLPPSNPARFYIDQGIISKFRYDTFFPSLIKKLYEEPPEVISKLWKLIIRKNLYPGRAKYENFKHVKVISAADLIENFRRFFYNPKSARFGDMSQIICDAAYYGDIDFVVQHQSFITSRVYISGLMGGHYFPNLKINQNDFNHIEKIFRGDISSEHCSKPEDWLIHILKYNDVEIFNSLLTLMNKVGIVLRFEEILAKIFSLGADRILSQIYKMTITNTIKLDFNQVFGHLVCAGQILIFKDRLKKWRGELDFTQITRYALLIKDNVTKERVFDLFNFLHRRCQTLNFQQLILETGKKYHGYPQNGFIIDWLISYQSPAFFKIEGRERFDFMTVFNYYSKQEIGIPPSGSFFERLIDELRYQKLKPKIGNVLYDMIRYDYNLSSIHKLLHIGNDIDVDYTLIMDLICEKYQERKSDMKIFWLIFPRVSIEDVFYSVCKNDIDDWFNEILQRITNINFWSVIEGIVKSFGFNTISYLYQVYYLILESPENNSPIFYQKITEIIISYPYDLILDSFTNFTKPGKEILSALKWINEKAKKNKVKLDYVKLNAIINDNIRREIWNFRDTEDKLIFEKIRLWISYYNKNILK